MSKHNPKITLQQIMTYAQRAQVLCMDRTLDELLADWQATWAFERAMQLLGESVKRLPGNCANATRQWTGKGLLVCVTTSLMATIRLITRYSGKQ